MLTFSITVTIPRLSAPLSASQYSASFVMSKYSVDSVMFAKFDSAETTCKNVSPSHVRHSRNHTPFGKL